MDTGKPHFVLTLKISTMRVLVVCLFMFAWGFGAAVGLTYTLPKRALQNEIDLQTTRIMLSQTLREQRDLTRFASICTRRLGVGGQK